MTTIAILQRCNDLGQRWLRTGGDHARTDASSHHRTQPTTATLNDNPDQKIELLLSARRVINRLQRLCRPTPHTFRATQFPIAHWRQPLRPIFRGFVPWRLSDAGRQRMLHGCRWPASETRTKSGPPLCKISGKPSYASARIVVTFSAGCQRDLP
jgi:hypothetical protein